MTERIGGSAEPVAPPPEPLDLQAIAIALDASERTWGRTHEMVMLGRALLGRVTTLEAALARAPQQGDAAPSNEPILRDALLKIFGAAGDWRKMTDEQLAAWFGLELAERLGGVTFNSNGELVGAAVVPREPSEAEIRAAYLAMPGTIDPDKNPATSAAWNRSVREMFAKALRAAYAVGRGTAPAEAPRKSKVTRIEVIDHRHGAPQVGRVFTAWNAKIELSYQDAGRTLKVFVDGVHK